MQSIRKVTEDILWVGCNDRRITLFENLFPVPKGVSYNSYLILDEKVTLMDTVDAPPQNSSLRIWRQGFRAAPSIIW